MQRSLTPAEGERYARHVLLPELGVSGQLRLAEATVAVVGAGGLGCPVLQYLVAAGVGTVRVIDNDVVDRSNLQRQVLYTDADVGRLKAEVAADRLRAQNPLVRVEAHAVRLTAANAPELLTGSDVIVNGADNFPTRYLVSDASVLLGIPHVHGAIHRFEGEVSVFLPGGACYRCLHPQPPAPGTVPSCSEAGVLGVLPGLVGVLQATETLKLLVGLGLPLVGRLLLIDALTLRFRELRLARNPACAACGDVPRIHALVDLAGVQCDLGVTSMREITPTELKAKLDRGDDFLLIDVREPNEFELCRIPTAQLIPLGTIPQRMGELDPDAEIVVQCRSGKRSADALMFLQANGFTNLTNLKGGILAWADEVDPTITKY
ncbi:molybdopterin-synthase adenylyltransferase MoeB [Armatimonas rosea]|uniref:Adenylyltransferase/sulfurtransferase n=1 Tax=Armatimonas rosea TaxID=685828 RepID=A0A7W9ST56_ARMRO|nr:molybdopterin-synthase adenylyltransferase MoeB [Armatimonas rosea]MBB6052221.1 adenylyltransferase/sulfurtransferase [Armatimonas rosea]